MDNVAWSLLLLKGGVMVGVAAYVWHLNIFFYPEPMAVSCQQLLSYGGGVHGVKGGC